MIGINLVASTAGAFVQQTGLRFIEQILTLSCSFRLDLNQNNEGYDSGHPVVLLKSDLDVQQPGF